MGWRERFPLLLLLLFCVWHNSWLFADAKCPLAHLAKFGLAEEAQWAGTALLRNELPKANIKAMQALDVSAVERDLRALMTASQPWWPADNGHYGGLLIRLAWHCSGSYRTWDGRGGCNGARIRFEPELSWEDNTNLPKARRLLEPVKAKYGEALSWGDLIVLAGNVAIESMGGPNIGVCLGRIDDADGTASLPLGPTPEQQIIAPCTKGDGMCEAPLGQTSMGLIYLNPEGVNGVPDPVPTVAHIRSVFARMGMNDQETVALIGGGHAFGKTHGACMTGAGPGPKESPSNPWPGTCGAGEMKGKGPNTYTSGFEGSWTQTPTKWDNAYFTNLLEYEWQPVKGVGGRWQWAPTLKPDATPHQVPNIMMLTSDIALLKDPAYLQLVQQYAADLKALTVEFGAAFYKLTTRSMGPVSRCLGGARVPPPQPFQLPLPPPSAVQPDWTAVRGAVVAAMTDRRRSTSSVLADTRQGRPHWGAQFAALAYNCAATFRSTDFQGGCNGGRIRFAPQSQWPGNAGLVDTVVERLQGVHAAFRGLSWADLIVLAGTVAVQEAVGVLSDGSSPFTFCPGRADAEDAVGTEHLAPREYSSAEIAFKDNAVVRGLTGRDAVALAARPRSAALQQFLGYSGSWTFSDAPRLSNDYFKMLLDVNWVRTGTLGKLEYRASIEDVAQALEVAPIDIGTERQGQFVYMQPDDMVIKHDPELAAIARQYAQDNDLFVSDFSAAWTKLMNADRFNGPVGNLCASAVAAAS